MKKFVLTLISFSFIFLLSACSDINQGEFPDLDDMKVENLSTEEMSNYLSEVTYDESMMESIKLNIAMNISSEETISTGSVWDNTFSIGTISTDVSGELNFLSVIDYNEDDRILNEMHTTLDFDFNVFMTGTALPYNQNYDYEGEIASYFTNDYLYLNTDVASSYNGVHTQIESLQKISNENIDLEMLGLDSPDLTDVNDLSLDVDEIKEMLDEFDQVTMYKDGSIDYLALEIDLESYIGNTDPTSNFDSLGIDLDDFDFDMSIVIAIKDETIMQVAMKLDAKLDDEGSYFNLELITDMITDMPDFPDDLDSYTEINRIDEMYSEFFLD